MKYKSTHPDQIKVLKALKTTKARTFTERNSSSKLDPSLCNEIVNAMGTNFIQFFFFLIFFPPFFIFN